MNTRKLPFLMAFLAVSLFPAPAFAGHVNDPWSHTFANGANRFAVLGQAVLDRETGLVWEKSPDPGAFTWSAAHDRCNSLILDLSGSNRPRMGFRVPTVQELTSILDQSVPGFVPHLPNGHPFGPLWSIGEAIWSATTDADNTANAWTMELLGSLYKFNKGSLGHAWCVRFRQGVDPQ